MDNDPYNLDAAVLLNGDLAARSQLLNAFT